MNTERGSVPRHRLREIGEYSFDHCLEDGFFASPTLPTRVCAMEQKCVIFQVTVPYVADDQLLRLVSANCPQLTVLDLSGAMELTDAGVKKW